MSRARSLAKHKITALGMLSLGSGLVLMVVGAITAQGWLFAAGLVLTFVFDLALPGVDPLVVQGMRFAGLESTVRTAARSALTLALVAVLDGPVRLTLLLVLAFLALRVGEALDNARLRRRANASAAARNIDLGAPSVPGPFLSLATMPRLVLSESLVLLPVALGASTTVVTVLGVVGLVLAAVVLALLERALMRIGSGLSAGALIPAAQRFLDNHRPVVVMYFSGGALSAYQLNTWLTTLERLDESTVIVLRERNLLDAIGTTRLPILCVPDAEDLMLLRFPTVRVALYAANVGNNIHFLRLPGVSSVFIGHGDSDKNASFNPFTRVHDEVWVAGPAGRARYERAAIGVRDEQIIEVGRPQLDRILGSPAQAGGQRTVLYAPTWEGWNEDQNYTSVPGIGVELARKIIADPDLRLVYRPHPFVGRRLASVRKAHEQILAMTEAADGLVWTPRQGEDAAGGALAQEAERDTAYAEMLGGANANRTVAIVGPDADILSCFRMTHGLVTDVSSVLSDYVATGKPIAVGNPRGAARADFIAEFPSTRAATLLTRDGKGLASFLDVVAGRAADQDTEARAMLREDLLGPATESLPRFEAAIRALAARAESWHQREESQPTV